MPQKQLPRKNNFLPFAIILGVALIAVAAGWWMLRGTAQSPDASPDAARAGASPASAANKPAATATSIGGASPAHTKGSEAAAVTIEEFADLQCPSCATMHAEMQKVLGEYSGRVRLVFRQFPLPTIHQNAQVAALATEAAARQGKFWEMQDYLYRNQSAWSTEADARGVFYNYARALNLDADRFMRDLRDPELARRVQSDARRGSALGVTGTPTLFLNGRRLAVSEVTPTGLRVTLDNALRSTSTGGSQNGNTGGNTTNGTSAGSTSAPKS